MSTRGFRSLIGACLLYASIATMPLGTLFALPASALAQPRLHPGLFALDVTAFPAGSLVVRSGVESNRQLVLDQPAHFGLPPHLLGRMTGYYMYALEGSADSGTPVFTSYLVSIFSSPHQAQRAFDYLWDTWFAANYYTSPPPSPVRLGSHGAVALFRSLDPSQPKAAELFFRRGSILVEVLQVTAQDDPTSDETHSLYAIARALNHVAGLHPTGI